MSRAASRLLASTLLLAIACGHATAPSAVSYAGQWSGTTSQGTPIAFSVSSDQKVTALTAGYSFSDCSGSAAFTPNVAVTNVPTAPVPVGSAAFDSGSPGSSNRMLVSFLFTTTSEAHGMIVFSGFAGCGVDPIVAAWTATKR